MAPVVEYLQKFKVMDNEGLWSCFRD
jgi:hypothetical protein